METIELNKLTDEQIEKELKEIHGKKDAATPEEKEKLNLLKEERTTRYQKRTDKLTWEKKSAQEKAEKLERELAEERQKREELEGKVNKAAKPDVREETVEYGGKKFYTDATLSAMVRNEELTPEQAYAHQRQRDKAEIKFEIEQESKNKSALDEEKKVRQSDWEAMIAEYPHFDAKHPDHDPNEPLFKQANELWREGLHANPRGLTLAIKRAKQILRLSDEQPDLSNEHSVGKSRFSSTPKNIEEKEATLTPAEKEAAVRIYSKVENPVTRRPYTEAEAIIKATKAKTARMRG